MNKLIFLSKTFWVGVFTALLPAFPAVAAVVSQHPQAVLTALGIVGIVLRYVTKDKVVLLP